MFAEKREITLLLNQEEKLVLKNYLYTIQMVHLMMKLLTMKLRVAWKAYGIQGKQLLKDLKTRGSQLTKLASMDLYNNGVPSSPRRLSCYRENKTILDALHDNLQQFIRKIRCR
jgi:hypothetical protein